MKTVLIPTDFSKNALHAIEYAKDLLKCEKTRFYILHAYGDEVYGPFGPKTKIAIEKEKERVRKMTDKNLEKLIAQVTEVPPNPRHSFKSISSSDPLVDAINDAVNEINIDLVVMGTKGKTNDKKKLFGSYTVQVFKYVACPVLAIPEAVAFEQPKKILFPTDFMLPYKRRELKLLNNLSAAFKAEVHSLYISDFEDLSHRQTDNKRFLSESLPDAYLFFDRTSLTNKAQAIREQISNKNIDFLIMVNSRHSFLEDLLHRSTVDQIGLTTKIPFLVMQNLPR